MHMCCLLFSRQSVRLLSRVPSRTCRRLPLGSLFLTKIFPGPVSLSSSGLWCTASVKMSTEAEIEREAILGPLRRAVGEQGEVVRRLKDEKCPKLQLAEAVMELKVRKKALESKEQELTPPSEKFDRGPMEELIKARFFYGPSFNIYGGVAGLYDFGPVGCAMKSNLLSLWRSHFILEEGMLEVDCSMLTPEPVLRASGHVDRFSDFMVKDVVTGDCYRADHILSQHLEQLSMDPKCTAEKKKEYEEVMLQVDNYSQSELGDLLRKYEVKATLTGNGLSAPVEFNLMFGTSIGPAGNTPGFLRPETAQGIFVNFKRLLDYNNGKLPFAVAQIGKAFRNEISPRSGLLRVREFEMAEIEHFLHPNKRNQFPKFRNVCDVKLNLYSACNQMDGKPPQLIGIGEAVRKGMVANETLGYYMARIHLFMLKVGVDPKRLRFRQHLSNEMAHYACDCWDAECRTSYGWVECVGCADRSCFDLTCHRKATRAELVAKENLSEPRVVDVVEAVPVKSVLGKEYRKESKAIIVYLSELNESAVLNLEKDLQEKGTHDVKIDEKTYSLKPNMISIEKYKKTIHSVDVVPSVIEPSFGIGRVMYSVLEHCFNVREEDAQRVWLALPPPLAPIGCAVLPLSGNDQFDTFVEQLADGLKRCGVSHKVDDSSGSIGRRYTRADAVGTPFAITVDFDSIKTSTATLRERNSMRQIRADVAELPQVVRALVEGVSSWKDVEAKYPAFVEQENTH